MFIPINFAGGPGIITDVPPHVIPPNAWSSGRNVRLDDGIAFRFLGHSLAFTPSIAPVGLFYIPYEESHIWVYPGLAKIYGTDGGVHRNLTRQVAGVDVDYVATLDRGWNGGVLSGILILNNGVDVPQMWPTPDLSVRMQDLTAWPANTKADVVRPYKYFLVALGITKAGTKYPYMVKWSHPADPGAVPSSWDHTDVTKLAGEVDLGQTADYLVDCLPLRDYNIIYKERTTWLMEFVGLPDVFKFRQILPSSGMFTVGCAVEFMPGYHAVLTQNDFIIHDGQSSESKIDRRRRRTLFSSIDSTNYKRTKLYHNEAFNEVWVCFPTSGSSYLDMAYVWNYRENNWTERELPNLIAAALGTYATSQDDSWDGGSSLGWDAGLDIAWNHSFSNPKGFKLLGASHSNSKIYLFDDTNLFDGSAFRAFVLREGFAVQEAKKDGNLTINTGTWKTLVGVRPRIKADPGTIIQINIGAQDSINAPVRWEVTEMFDPNEPGFKVDCVITGRLFAVEISSQGDHFWQIDGLDFDVVYSGEY